MLPVGNTEMTLLAYRRMLRAMQSADNTEITLLAYRRMLRAQSADPGMSSQLCPEEFGDVRLQQLLSDSSWHHRPAPKPVDTAGLPLAFISFGSHPWHLVHASLFIRSCTSGKTGQLISLLREAI